MGSHAVKMHLGVIDVPYGAAPKAKKKGKSKLKSTPSMTTGDVAEILEAKYHPMEVFFTVEEKKITRALENSLEGALETILMGGPPSLDPLGGAMSTIEDMFKRFITEKKMDSLGYPGVPTKASLAGVNHRLLHPFAKNNPRRPSFVDTGAYVGAFKAWVD